MKLYYIECSKYKVRNEEYRFKPPLGYSEYLMDKINDAEGDLEFLGWDSKTKEIICYPGFDFDPSGPTVDDETNIRASCDHDAMYKLIRHKLLPRSFRKKADKHMNKILKEDKMPAWRRFLWFFGLSKGAGFAANPKNIKKVKTVGK